MAKSTKVRENFSLRFNSRDDHVGDTLMDCNIEFENPKDDSIIMHRLNTWLTAIGKTDIVVVLKENKLGGS